MKTFLRDRLRASPFAFGVIGRRGEHPDFDRRVVRRGDDLVIEGFPRSGNTFATMAFRLAQPNPLKIGNHFHAPAQILRARQFAIPAMVVIREPMAAALSFLVYHQGRMSAARALEQYVAFHKPLLGCLDEFSIAPFEEVVSDFNASIARLNAKFGTDFVGYEPFDELNTNAMAAIEEKRLKRLEKRGDAAASDARKTTPSAEKDAQKDKFRASLAAPALAGLRDDAAMCYNTILNATVGK